MAMHPSVAQHLDEIRTLAAEYGVEKLEIFGSAMIDAFDPERSDVDFIVHYPEGYVFGPFGRLLQEFEEDLTKVLGRQAQLVMTSSLRKEHFRNNANKTRTIIYECSEVDRAARRLERTVPISR